jgi:uncharacterized protein (TIGR02246 family)
MMSDEQQIFALKEEWKQAVQSRDLDRTMATYWPGPEYLGFDVMPPFEFIGSNAFRDNWIKFFAMFDGDPQFEFRDVRVHCAGDVAFSTGLTRFAGSVQGKQMDLWTRETLGYRKSDGRWLIIHDHISVPIDLESGHGVRDFQP